MKKLNRRYALGLLGASMAGMGMEGWMQNPVFANTNIPVGNNPNLAKKKVFQIFLNGGIDTPMTTDPVIGDKKTSGGYEALYNNKNVIEVNGKSNLKIGEAAAPAKEAFASIPTSFINGIFMEVTAHELAVRYMYSGRLSLGNSRQFPSFLSLLGLHSEIFPSQVILGSKIPLGETAYEAPPLQAPNIDELLSMLGGPQTHFIANPGAKYPKIVNKKSISVADEVSQFLDDTFIAGRHKEVEEHLKSWTGSVKSISRIYAKEFHKKIVFDDDMRSRYGVKGSDSVGAKIAGGFLSMKSGLSRFTSVNFNGFDTHDNHMGNHIPLLTEVFGAVNELVKDLKATEDPQVPGTTMADNTIIVILSDFARTPKFNSRGGTDHWKSGSAIIMGGGVADNRVFGATDEMGNALGWEDGKAVPKTDTNVILPDHLSAAILRHFSLGGEASIITKEDRIDALFT